VVGVVVHAAIRSAAHAADAADAAAAAAAAAADAAASAAAIAAVVVVAALDEHVACSAIFRHATMPLSPCQDSKNRASAGSLVYQ